MQAELLVYMPDATWLKQQRKSGFSGSVAVYSWEGAFRQGYNYENGRAIGRFSLSESGGRTLDAYVPCAYADYYYRVCTSYGCSEWKYSYTEVIYCWVTSGPPPVIDYEISYPDPNAGGGGGGGSAGGDVYTSLPLAITDNLTNTCLKGVLSYIRNSTPVLPSMVVSILQNFNVSTTKNIEFKEFQTTPDVDGDEIPLNPDNSEIRLNTNALANASEEYIAATIFHEILHSYLTLYEDFDRNLHHDEMANKYVYPMADAIKAMYPSISTQDAIDLAWGGLHATNAWNELSSGAKDRINETIEKYKNLNETYNHIGTRCRF